MTVPHSGVGLATLLTLADSRLPIGGHVHSGGVEEAIAEGLVRDLPTLEAYLLRRMRISGAVAASIAAAVAAGVLPADAADRETDARTPSPAARAASRAQGRGLRRLAETVWPDHDWTAVGRRPHLPVVAGVVGAVTGAGPYETASVQIYTAMTGAAIAAQRLLALDPGAVAGCTVALAAECDRIAASVARTLPALSDESDPLLDHLGERHVRRERPLFVS
ncbi:MULTISPECIES: urease accessory protein UreF [Nocardiaceae]|uniref:Urease accessory protein n=1 Tax=Rhodococcoides corynebacterioides TaxID=53972 RepID=A0ABS2KRC6_9NOCA|nr:MULTISPECIES: urease accessory UreF family protein [Rhodococcus]MBM7414520.1 urease accessory protein [Rhodococcus corynebacterioides]MBP1116982.1 urease accessory protein [Rhodococcus sp. PvP016]